MSARVFLVNVEPPETRVAEVRGGRLFDLDIERDARLLGNIYKGRVENVVPGMDAAFVDIGESRNALLYVGDVPGSERPGASISRLLKPREEILVQVARPPVGTKGARVTMRLSIPGRSAIVVSGSETSGVSKRIESSDERARLRRIAERLRPLDRGLILRTEAEKAPESVIAADVALISARLDAVIGEGARVRAPELLHEDLGLLGRLARDRISDDVSAIYIDSRAALEAFTSQLRLFDPTLARLVQLYSEPTPIFERWGVARAIEDASQRRVSLPSGGSLVIDEAEALTAIDVNTGSNVSRRSLSETVVATNLEAVEAIALQLRLRDIGGIVAVDFIDMDKTRDRVRVLNALETALRDDRNRTRIVQLSPSGLVEMNRRREGQSLRLVAGQDCPHCGGSGLIERADSLAIQARRKVRQLALLHPSSGVLARLHPEVALPFAGENGEWLRDLERDTGARLHLRADPDIARAQTQLERVLPGVMPGPRPQIGALVPLSDATNWWREGERLFALWNGWLLELENAPPELISRARSADSPQLPGSPGSEGQSRAKASDARRDALLVQIQSAGPHLLRGRLASTAPAIDRDAAHESNHSLRDGDHSKGGHSEDDDSKTASDAAKAASDAGALGDEESGQRQRV